MLVACFITLPANCTTTGEAVLAGQADEPGPLILVFVAWGVGVAFVTALMFRRIGWGVDLAAAILVVLGWGMMTGAAGPYVLLASAQPDYACSGDVLGLLALFGGLALWVVGVVGRFVARPKREARAGSRA